MQIFPLADSLSELLVVALLYLSSFDATIKVKVEYTKVLLALIKRGNNLRGIGLVEHSHTPTGVSLSVCYSSDHPDIQQKHHLEEHDLIQPLCGSYWCVEHYQERSPVDLDY